LELSFPFLVIYALHVWYKLAVWAGLYLLC